MLTQEQLAALPNADRERYTQLEELFGTAGWRVLKTWAEKSAEIARERVLTAPSWDGVVFARGQLAQLSLLANFEQAVLTEFQTLAAERSDAQAVLNESSAEFA